MNNKSVKKQKVTKAKNNNHNIILAILIVLCLVIIFLGFSYIKNNEKINFSPTEESGVSNTQEDYSLLWVIIILTTGIITSLLASSIKELYHSDIERTPNYNK